MIRLLLILSTVCNLILGGLLARHLLRPGSLAPSQEGQPGEVQRREVERPLVAEGNVKTPEIQPLQWSQLDQSTWFTYRDSLLKVGCPQGTVREILEPLVEREYRAQLATVLEPYVKNFWDTVRPPEGERSKQIEREGEPIIQKHKELLEKLFAGFPEVNVPDDVQAETEAAFSFLPARARNQALEIWETCLDQEEEFKRNFRGNPAEARDRMKALEDQRDRELGLLLSPEELAELRLRQSPSAAAAGLDGLSLTTKEVREVIRIKEQLRNDPEGGDPSARVSREREEIGKLLGPLKAAEVARGEDPNFQQLAKITQRLEATHEQTIQLWEAQESAVREAGNVLKQSGLGADDQLRQLEAIRQQLSQRASSILGGDRGRATWERSQRDWLNNNFSIPKTDVVSSLLSNP
jgi:hypothetical protein